MKNSHKCNFWEMGGVAKAPSKNGIKGTVLLMVFAVMCWVCECWN